MIGSLFEDLQPLPQNGEEQDLQIAEDLSLREREDDDSLLAAIPVVQKIVRRKTVSVWHSDAADLVQGVILRLLKWRKKYREKSDEMSADEWQSLAATTAYNEVNRHFSSNRVKEVSFDGVQEIAATQTLEGQSKTEVCSLVTQVWQKICGLSLRQRQALILNNKELVVYLLKSGFTDEELAENLNLKMKEWMQVKNKLPLRDFQIGELINETDGNSRSVEAIARSMKKARHEARLKVRRAFQK